MWVEAEEVVPLPLDRSGELLEGLLLGGDPRGVVRGRIAAVETDLGAGVEQRLDEPRAKSFVLLFGRPSSACA